MARIFEKLIKEAYEEELFRIIDIKQTNVDSNALCRLMIEENITPNEAATELYKSGKTEVSQESLSVRAYRLRKWMIKSMSDITPQSLVEEIKQGGKVVIPDELNADVRNLLKKEDIIYRDILISRGTYGTDI